MRARGRSIGAGLAGITIIATMLAACSSGSSGSSSAASQDTGAAAASTAPASAAAASGAAAGGCVSKMASTVSSATAVPAFSMPGDVSAAPLKGKLVVAVAEDESIPDDVTWISGLNQAAPLIGAHIQVINGQGTTTGETAAIQQAISLHPAAILIWGITETSVSGAISALKASGLPWDNVYDNTGNGKYIISINWVDVGKLEADYVLSQTNCKPDSVVFTSSVFTTSIVPEVTAYQQEIAAQCPSCKTTVINLDPTTIATDIQPDTVAAVHRDPNVNYFLAGYDGEASYIIAGLQQVGKKIPVIGNTGTSVNVTNVASGTPQTADVEHVPVPELAFMSFDDVLRQLAHLPAAAQWYPLPNILITPANVTAAQAHLSSTAYEADFKTIWGLG
jgi:ribose transport system substrate-binding protein